MDIYTYFLFSYGLTAAIALVTIGIIVMLNKALQSFNASGADKQKSHGV